MTTTLNNTTSVVFHAIIRQTQNAISLGSNGEGGIVQFELPETSLAALSELMKLRRTELVITVMRAGTTKTVVAAEKQASDPAANQTGHLSKPSANGDAPAKRKKAANAQNDRTPEQRINAEAWQLLIHRSPDGHGRGFARCPGVLEDLTALRTDADKHEHDTFHRIFGRQLRNVGREELRDHYAKSNTALSMIDAAWTDAEINLAALPAKSPQPSEENLPL